MFNKFINSYLLLLLCFFLSSCSIIESHNPRTLSSSNKSHCFNFISNFFNRGANREVEQILAKEKYALPAKYDGMFYVKEKYIGESEGNAKYPDFKNKKIKYLNENEKRNARVFFTSQGLFQNSDILSCKSCELIIVLDEYGRMYAGVPKKGEFHHSSFFAGNAVASAGSIKIEKGIITGISNVSGHYSPDQTALFRILDVLLAGNQTLPKKLLYIDEKQNPHEYQLSEIAKRHMAGFSQFERSVDREISQGVIKVLLNHNHLRNKFPKK